jgi:anti-sigma B factor antagonist
MEPESAKHDLGPSIICPAGDLDYYSAWQLRAEIHKGLAESTRGLIVSLEDVPFMDSTGLGVLAGAWKKAREINAPFHIVCGGERLYKSFRITGLNKVMNLHSSVPEALAAVVLGYGWQVQE